jgi:P27 family predicted phage terminase small subunit
VIGDRAVPEPPDHLPPGARAAWDELAPELAEAGVLRTVDAPAFEALCLHLSVLRAAEVEWVEGGCELTVPGTKNATVPNPLLAVMRQESVEVRQWAERFGLDPASRTRLGLAAVKGRTLEQELARRRPPR